jgi:hypothetical protein
MNLKLIAVFFLSALSQVSTCKKQNVDCSNAVEGLWIGTYTYDPVTSPNRKAQYFSFIIKPDGALLVESKDNGVDYFAKGNWTIEGNNLRFNYVYTNSVFSVPLSQTANATFVKTGTLESGRWSNVSNKNEKGTFTMKRVN